MRKIAIFHYSPLELFPPVMNMATYFAESLQKGCDIRVYTTYAGPGIEYFEVPPGHNVTIYRKGGMATNRNPIIRFLLYVWFHVFSFFHCLFWWPNTLFYIETISAAVPLVIKNIFRRGIPLFIHYHEYMSPEDYNRTAMMKFIHFWEKKTYNRAAWISHTNEQRLEMFLNDIRGNKGDVRYRVMPNYPLQSWAGGDVKGCWNAGNPLKLIYTGAVDLETLFFPEMIKWVEAQDGLCTLDILSNQDTGQMSQYLSDHGCRFVRVQDPVPYFQLPGKLKNYDVGVILYKGTYINFVYNAPNKLFEYLSVGLDVWYPENMEGIHPYKKSESHPMVKSLDFEHLDRYKPDHLYDDGKVPFVPTKYFAEHVYEGLLKAMSEKK